MDLHELTSEALIHWPFSEESYPGLAGLSPEAQKQFALRHILLHQAKALGKLAEVVEPMDHGGQIDEAVLRRSIRNFLINTLRLASEAGVSTDELVSEVRAWASAPRQPAKVEAGK